MSKAIICDRCHKAIAAYQSKPIKIGGLHLYDLCEKCLHEFEQIFMKKGENL